MKSVIISFIQKESIGATSRLWSEQLCPILAGKVQLLLRWVSRQGICKPNPMAGGTTGALESTNEDLHVAGAALLSFMILVASSVGK